MEVIKDLGQIEISPHNVVTWRIPNFYDLPQNYDTVIRSPRVHYDNSDWYMEVYPNGRNLYCSLGWIGVRLLNFNCYSYVRGFCYFFVHDPNESNWIIAREDSNGDGSYCCTRLLPASLLKFWKDIFLPKGEMYLAFEVNVSVDLVRDATVFKLQTDDVQKLFQNQFENVSVELSDQAEEKKELPLETTVGELDIDSEKVKWIVPNFSDLLQRYDTAIRSPRFQYKDSDWYIEVYPNGRSLYASLGWFGIGVCNLNSNSTLPCTTVNFLEENYQIDVTVKADSQNKGFCYCSKLLPTSLFKSWQDVIAPGGNLQVFFVFELNDKHEDDDEDENYTGNIIHMTFSKEIMQRWYKEKFENADTFIEASTQTEEEIVKEDLKQNDGGASIEKCTETEKGLEKMRQDFQEILFTESISDIVLNVKSHAFKAHRCILAARSPVFLAMMTQDTKVKNTGVVDIPDVDPNAFSQFLKYLYTGSVSNITSENAAILYTLADMYQVNELKESCKDLMMRSISNANPCDYFISSA